MLCLAVMLSVMVVGAGAAFSDQDKIENTEAVDACSALNIINGYEDGAFHPERNIKRAEVTKMICVALNGGEEPNTSTGTDPIFSDVRGTMYAWAEGYIEACYAQGIVDGVGGTRFAPAGNVTAAQLAKMLLVSLGYSAKVEKFTGASWETYVNVRASQKHLYDGLDKMDTSAPVTRDQAARMIWNAMQAYEVEYKDGVLQDKVVGDNRDKITLLEDKYEADTAIGTFDGNSDVTDCKDGNIQISNATINGATVEVGGVKKAEFQFKYDLDLKYLGEEIKVLYKDGKDGRDGQLDDKDTIYGVYVTGATSVVNAVQDDIDDNYNTANKVSINDKAYKVAKTGKIITNYIAGTPSSTWTNNAGDGVAAIEALGVQNGNTVKFILNDSNEIETVYVVQYNIAKVTAVNNSKISLKGVGSIDIEDNEIYKDIAKDDVVVYKKLYNTNVADATFVVTKAETVSGKLTGYKGTPVEKVTIDGKAYSTMDKDLVGDLTDDAKTTFQTGDINETVTAYLVNGFVGCVDMADSASNYAYIESAGSGTIGGADEFKMKVILADGTEKTVTVDEDGTVNKKDSLVDGAIIKYASISDNNVMDVSAVVTTKNAADTTDVYDKDTKTFDGIITTSDAVLFVKTTGNNYYAYNIRSLGDILTVTSAKYVLDKDGKVEAAFVEMDSKPSGATSDTVYGIVTAANGTVKVGDEYKSEFKVANNKSEYTVYMPTTSQVVKGDVVSFDLASDNIYGNSDVKVYASADAKYIDELDKDNVLSYYDSIGGSLITKALDSDAQIVYVDQDKDAAGQDIGVGEYDAIDQYANAVVVDSDNDGKIDAIIVESSGECNVVNGMNKRYALGADADAAKISEALSKGDVEISGDLAAAATISVPGGKKLKITSSQTQAHDITVENGAQVIVSDNATIAENSVLKAEAGATVVAGGREIIGENSLSSSAEIALKVLADNKMEYTLSGDAELGGTLEISGNDALKGAFTVTGKTGAVIKVYNSAVLSSNEWKLNIDSTADQQLAKNSKYTWSGSTWAKSSL